MSEFIHRTKIAALEQTNKELLAEISKLENKIENLAIQLEQLKREKTDEIKHLKDPGADESERTEHRPSKSKEDQLRKTYESVEQLLSSLEKTDYSIVKSAMARYHKKQNTPKIIVAFLSGMTLSLFTWLVVEYLKNDQQYNAIIKRALGYVSN